MSYSAKHVSDLGNQDNSANQISDKPSALWFALGEQKSDSAPGGTEAPKINKYHALTMNYNELLILAPLT